MELQVVGCSGSAFLNHFPTTFVINNILSIDAGSLCKYKHPEKIENIIITHTHLDHIRDLTSFLDGQGKREKKLNIWGNKESCKCLNEDIFNDTVWPSLKNYPYVTLNILPDIITLSNLTIIKFLQYHIIKTFGVIIKENNKTLIINSDGYLPKRYNQLLLEHKPQMILYETVFDKKHKHLAKIAKHLTTEDVMQGNNIFLYHLKPHIEKQIKQDLEHTNPQYLEEKTYYI